MIIQAIDSAISVHFKLDNNFNLVCFRKLKNACCLSELSSETE